MLIDFGVSCCCCCFFLLKFNKNSKSTSSFRMLFDLKIGSVPKCRLTLTPKKVLHTLPATWYWDQNINKYHEILGPRYQQISIDIETKISPNIKWYLDQVINKYQKIYTPKNQQISNDIETKNLQLSNDIGTKTLTNIKCLRQIIDK